MNQDQTSLDEVKSQLSKMVKTLIGQYSLSDITTALRINTSQIKDNLKMVSNHLEQINIIK
jgi:predicted DNA-binding protein YlxM (UPF0122 family)